MGFPAPEIIGPFVGTAEGVFGALMLAGLATRAAALGPRHVRSLDAYGFWSMAHEMRADWAMFLGPLVLVDAGGPWSLDRMLGRVRSGAGL